jgi:hypothetical protein
MAVSLLVEGESMTQGRSHIMKKTMTRRFLAALAVCGVFAQSLQASAAPPSLVAQAFGSAHAAVESLDAAQAEQTRGRLLPLVLSIAGVDLALAGLFWGVYVPRYAPQTGACTACAGSSLSTH